MLGLLGYTDPLSIAPGQEINVKVSVESGAQTYRAELVRLFCGDDDPNGPGFRAVHLNSQANGEYPGFYQPASAGSYVCISPSFELESLASFTIVLFVWVAALRSQRQTLVCCWSEEQDRGFKLFLDKEGTPVLQIGDGHNTAQVKSRLSLVARDWSMVAASFNEDSGEVAIGQCSLGSQSGSNLWIVEKAVSTTRAACHGLPLLFGATLSSTDGASTWQHFNGKLERPRLASAALSCRHWHDLLDNPLDEAFSSLLVGAWDFSQKIESTEVVDISATALHGEAINLPTRGVTSSMWNGDCHRPSDNLSHYAALQFHEDDLYDVGWTTSFSWRVPDDFLSGIYAFRLSDGQSEEYVPFFIRPTAAGKKSKIAFLASTATYIAYANTHASYNETLEEMQWGSVTELSRSDVYLSGNLGLGVSLYDSHSDGTPVFYSSRHRPILNMRPQTAPWNFCADLHIIDWLDRQNYMVDVVTDEDLDAEPNSLLTDYSVLVTGTHPEYWSSAMLDALTQFQSAGGRLVYLGGNGFYWRITFNQSLPGVLECRKTEGVRLLDTPPGERHHSFDGKLGGLWRSLGRAPQQLTGVGTTAFGFASCGFYRRAPDSHKRRVSFVFEGVTDELIGNFGVTGGAVGFEIDRTDRLLGTPEHCLVLAVSEPLGRFYVPAPEEMPFLHSAITGDENPNIRAEMVFFEGPNKGAVFSTGSITWAASLAHNGYENNVSRITRNVLDRFLDPRGFD